MIAEELNVSKRAANLILNAIVDNMIKALEKGEKVTLDGFGTFNVVERAARTIIHPKTKRTIRIHVHKAVIFNASKSLKTRIKSQYSFENQ